MAVSRPPLFQRFACRRAMPAALALLAVLAWLVTMQPFGAAASGMDGWSDHAHGVENPRAHAAATTDHDRGDHSGSASACGACPSFCCAAALPMLSPPEPRQDATRTELSSLLASLLAGRSPTPDPPPPRQL